MAVFFITFITFMLAFVIGAPKLARYGKKVEMKQKLEIYEELKREKGE